MWWQLDLRELPNESSKKLNALLNTIRRQRCGYLRYTLANRSNYFWVMFLELGASIRFRIESLEFTI